MTMKRKVSGMVTTGVPSPYLLLSTTERHSNWRLRSDAARCALRFAAGVILCPSHIVRKEVLQIGALFGRTLSKFDEVCGNQTANCVSVFFHVCSLHKDAFVWLLLSHWHKKSVKWCLMVVTLCQTDRWLIPVTIVSRSFTLDPHEYEDDVNDSRSKRLPYVCFLCLFMCLFYNVLLSLLVPYLLFSV